MMSGMSAGIQKGLWWLREKRRWGPTGVGGALYTGRGGGHAGGPSREKGSQFILSRVDSEHDGGVIERIRDQ